MDLVTSAVAVPLAESVSAAGREEALSPLPQPRLPSRQPLSCIPALAEPE